MNEAPAQRSLGPTLDMLRLLSAVNHQFAKLSRYMDARTGVSGRQHLILQIVGEHPDISAIALADELEVHPATVTGLLKMMQRDLLYVRSDRQDGRRVRIRLTPKGRQIHSNVVDMTMAAVSATLRRVSPAEQRAAHEVLTRLARNLN